MKNICLILLIFAMTPLAAWADDAKTEKFRDEMSDRNSYQTDDDEDLRHEVRDLKNEALESLDEGTDTLKRRQEGVY